ncbi:MAG: secondary thiamine-phosphate synthase enzyme YjbQ [Thermodesulfovibrionales bacterium]|nr:secondary thiamine-phosphate synthase enzyme YjbQ [Thermodesulfovibrionales bacterium]
MTKTINIKTKSRTEFVDITDEVSRLIKESSIKNGICCLFVPHTTAGITINEGADPSVKRDILTTLNRLIPFEGDYQHTEGNSAAHIKSTLTGVSITVIFENSNLLLGTWQSIFFCEFDGPRHRRVILKITSS